MSRRNESAKIAALRRRQERLEEDAQLLERLKDLEEAERLKHDASQHSDGDE